MSNFVPHPLNDCPPPLEEPSQMLQVAVNIILATLYFVITLLFRFATDSVPDPLDDTLPALGEEASHPEHPQDPREAHLSGVQQVVVTAIRATDLTLGLRWIPAGFHVVVKVDSAECQTSNKPVHVDQGIVEWNERILLPCKPSSLVRVSVYASFELDPMLGHGEVLRTFEISVGELLDRSEESRPIIFQPKQEEVVSPCTSLFMTVEQRQSHENDAAVLRPLTTLTFDDMHELVLRTDAGHCLLARYRRTQNARDLDQSITHFEQASDLCPMNRPCRPAALFNLAAAKFVSCQVNGTYLDLDIPICLFQDAFDLRPIGHPDRPITQFHLAIAMLSRFAKRGFQTDADAAEELLSEVLDVCHANSHIYRAALLAIETFTLHRAAGMDGHDLRQIQPAVTMLPLSPNQLAERAERCWQRDDPHDLDEVISLHYDALRYYDTMHHCRGQLLCNLGVSLSTRFERRGNSQDLEEAITLLRNALALCPVGHPHRPASLINLATVLSTRFQHRGNDQDLDDAIMLERNALDLHPVGHADRSMSLDEFASGLFTRFQHRGNVQDLDDAIMLHRDSLALRPVGHPYRSASLNKLASAFSTRFKHRGNDKDMDDAIVLHRDALALRPVGHPDRSMSLNDLANVIFARFQRRGNDHDVDEAIMLHGDALALRPVGHRDRPASLNNLASTLSTRFKHRGNYQDSHEAITLLREALDLLPVGHSDRPASLSNLASALSTRFKHQSNDQDLDEIIMLLREALDLFPVGHPDRSGSLSNLASTLSTRFKHRGNDQDLDDAIMLQRDALALHPVGHADRSASLNNLANRLSTRFEHRGNDQDLDDAIMLHRDALALCPVGHADRSMSLSNLANQLSTRFKHRGNDEDLDDAIMIHRDALALCPVGHADRSGSLSNLANVLFTRFEHRGNDQDLDDAIMLHRDALALRPVGHADRSASLNNLAHMFSTCFEHRGNDKDLDDAIMLHRDALALRPVGHADRSMSLSNLANKLSTRFEHRGNDQDLDDAIMLHRDALALRPVGHADRSASLNNLANRLSTRFKHRGNDQDLDDAIMLHRDALALHPVGHADRSASLHNLAFTLSTRFENRGNAEDLHESRENLRCALTSLTQYDPRQIQVHQLLATVYLSFHRSELDGTGEDNDSLTAAMHHRKVAANVVSGGLLSRLRASLRWVRDADQYSHDTELEAYATSMQLLDAYMSATASVSTRHITMKEFPRTLAVNAASCALRSGDVCRAVELLEQGRTVIWTQMTRLRTPLDSLQECGEHAVALMKKFRDLSSLLDTPPTNHPEGTTRVIAEAEASRYRRLVEDWNRAVEEIRKIEGFSRFLLPPLFSDLQDAARDGPIIVLIASKSSCDAIIIPHKQPPISIKLCINLEKLQHLVHRFQSASQPQAATKPPEAAPTPAPKPIPKSTQSALMKALRELWNDVVHPVVEHLGRFAPSRSRIWWCPTGAFNFLPLHAAGEYRAHGQSLSQLYISSYTPSLTALIRARRSHDRSLSVPFAAIGQNHPAGHSFTLDCVEPELELVRSLLPPPPTVSFTKITSVEATKSRALCALQHNTWLHFACHGTQNFAEPFNSAFLMRDQPLSLLDISQMDLSLHQFAFLSACETAVGNFHTPDEVVHLAAGLQFAGVQSVVGTLWSVNDSTVQRLVEAFYKNLCGDGKMNSKRAARALHHAVQSLAGDKDMPLDQRIVFIHIGI